MPTRPQIDFTSLAGRAIRQAVLFMVLSSIAFPASPNFVDTQAFCLQFVDAENLWPIPLVQLTTTHGVVFVSDNNGKVAFDLPELLNKPTWLHIHGHGYSVSPDRFGYRGIRVTPRSGEKLTVKLQRQLPGKRLGRITGAGLFAESQKLGDESTWTEQNVLGCDSVQTTIHNGRRFWAWGDTHLSRYPLGRFHMIGATSPSHPLQRFQPPIKLRYRYFTDDEQLPRDIARMPGEGPTWLSGLVSLPDKNGIQQLGATYSKIKPPLSEYERGLCIWDAEQQNFQQLKVLWTKSEDNPTPPLAPTGHAVLLSHEEQKESVLFGHGFPTLKCPATFEDWSNPQTWQSLESQKVVNAADSDQSIAVHRASIAWNHFRKKWVAVFTELGGQSSHLGEIWYAESDSATGPWRDAIKVVTHDRYTFYNPRLHADWGNQNSPILLFEATYTRTFSRTKIPTPRHDYNQILYRLDLDQMNLE